MSLRVNIGLRCDGCGVTIQYAGGTGTSSKDAVDVAVRRYGWAVGAHGKARCFDCRKRPIPFHTLDPIPGVGMPSWAPCKSCEGYDNPEEPYHAVHRQEAIELNATKLRNKRIVTWGRE